MKNLTPLLIPVLIVLWGCTKEDPVTTTQRNKDQSVYMAQFTTDGFKILEELSYAEFTGRMSTGIELRSNPNALANGDFSFTTPESATFDVKGNTMQNPSGTHGAVEQSGPGFIWEGDAHCVTTFGENDNKAVVGSVVTENIELPFPIDVGWNIYTAVEDNDEGANAPSDKVSLIFYITPPGFPSACSDLANDGSFPAETFVDINEGGWVQVQ